MMTGKCVTALFLFLSLSLSVLGTANFSHTYIVIGAGPAGLQMGYFLHKAQRDYIILERNNISGSFYDTYPRHDKLISINKRFTGRKNKEFNLRHDWNSLLSDDESLLFKHYSKDYFPHRESALNYLSDFAKKFQLNIEYNTIVGDIRKDENGEIVMKDQHQQVYKCRTLFIGTGMWKPNVPDIEGIEHTIGYEAIPVNSEDYEGKSVLILGKGNTAFETASAIYGSANLVHLVSRSRVRLSWQTHYVGDLRGVNNEVLDTYQLKSLDGLLEGPLNQLVFRKNHNKIEVALKDNITWDNYALRENYDLVIRCLGWTFDHTIFANQSIASRPNGKLSKFPEINRDYSLLNMEGAYVIGTIGHSLDYRKSSGGFIHGFRYTVRAVHRMLESRNHNVRWPSITVHYLDLVSTITKRINEASGIYQMFGVLVDVIALNRTSSNASYFEEYPIQLLSQFKQNTGHPLHECIILVLEYGKNFSGPSKDVFYPSRAVGQASRAHKSNFLHPVFYYYENIEDSFKISSSSDAFSLPKPDRLHHSVEDFLGVWDTPNTHILPLRRFIEYCTNTDLRSRFSSTCFMLTMTGFNLPHSCSGYLFNQGLVNPSQSW